MDWNIGNFPEPSPVLKYLFTDGYEIWLGYCGVNYDGEPTFYGRSATGKFTDGDIRRASNPDGDDTIIAWFGPVIPPRVPREG